jgi:eukaryotic-like serine/threonine-protein kinase
VSNDEPELAQQVTAARPAEDSVRRAVRLAHLSATLFGVADAVLVGRYRLTRELGRGGGGSVFAAHDPELHRDVAVKLIACSTPSQRARALAEAQTLAAFAHPNVVPVHDVGETSDHVFLVMELLPGPSLRDFAAAPTHSGRAVLAAYRQAALGLAAAHAAGLVHRDFKPDHALLGADGRVRVVDFGLATMADVAGVVAGTPGYLAPDQASGAPAIDQFALGVSLREALRGRTMPRRIGRLVARATATHPGDRFPSMQALADALGDEPRVRWVKRGLIVAPALLAAVGFFAGRGADARACDGGPAALANAWVPAQVEQLDAHLDALGTPLALALRPHLTSGLRAKADEWLAAHRQACVNHRQQVLTDDAFERAMGCLGRGRAGLGEAAALVGAATDETLDSASAAVAALESFASCAEPLALAADGRPPLNEAGRALAERHAVALLHTRAATAQAPVLAAEAVAAGRALGNRHLLARTLLTLGQSRLKNDRAGAIEPLHEALLLALAEGDDVLAVEAWARHAFARGRSTATDPLRALEGLDVMTAMAQRAGEAGVPAHALLLNNAGSVAMTAGDFTLARTRLEAAATLSERVKGPEAVELVAALTNLALVSSDRGERARRFSRALTRLRELVGEAHAQTLDKTMLAVVDGDEPTLVVHELVELCPRFARLHPALQGSIETCAFQLAWQAFAQGDLEALRVAAALVDLKPVGEGKGPSAAVAVYLALGEHRDLTPALPRLRAEAVEVRGSQWFHHIDAADAELLLAAVAGAVGERAEPPAAAARAQAHLEQALSASAPHGSLLRRRQWAQALEIQR